MARKCPRASSGALSPGWRVQALLQAKPKSSHRPLCWATLPLSWQYIKHKKNDEGKMMMEMRLPA